MLELELVNCYDSCPFMDVASCGHPDAPKWNRICRERPATAAMATVFNEAPIEVVGPLEGPRTSHDILGVVPDDDSPPPVWCPLRDEPVLIKLDVDSQ